MFKFWLWWTQNKQLCYVMIQHITSKASLMFLRAFDDVLQQFENKKHKQSVNIFSFFDLLLSKPMFPLFLWLLGRKVLNTIGPYINPSQTKIGYVCLSIISAFCLSSVCSSPTAYTSLCRGLKYLLKISYFIQDYPYMAVFFFF